MIAFKINALRQKLRRQFYSAQNVIEFISSLALFVDSSLQLHSLKVFIFGEVKHKTVLFPDGIPQSSNKQDYNHRKMYYYGEI